MEFLSSCQDALNPSSLEKLITLVLATLERLDKREKIVTKPQAAEVTSDQMRSGRLAIKRPMERINPSAGSAIQNKIAKGKGEYASLK